MVELTNLRNEILNCILLGLYQASIFSTNHLLERLIKLSLIKNHTLGLNYLNEHLLNERTEESKLLFDSLTLSKSLKKAKENDLINEAELKELTSLKNKIRNPYSHAEVSKINEERPKSVKGFMFNLEDIKRRLINKEELELPKAIEINTFSPAFAQLQQEESSRTIALEYFKRVHEIMLKIESRISEKRKKSL